MTMLDDRDQATADEVARRFGHIMLDRPTPSVASRGRSSRRILAAAAGIAASVAGLVVVWPHGERDAFAGWTPAPRAAQPGEVAGVLDACNGRIPDASIPAPADAFGPTTHLEFRGEVGLAIATIGGGVLSCTARRIDDGWYAFGIGSQPNLDAAPTLSGGGGDDEMTWLVKGVHRDAARVELTVPGYPPIAATVVDGVYFAWWPDQDRDPGATDLPRLRVDIYDVSGELVDSITW